MQSVHHRLMRENTHYAKWHHNPRHHLYHWAIFFSIALLLGAIAITYIGNDQNISELSSYSSYAQIPPTPAVLPNVALSLVPSASTVAVGSTVKIEAWINTSDTKATAAEVTILYPSVTFDVVSFTIPGTALLPTILAPRNASDIPTPDISTPGKAYVVIGSGTQSKTGQGVIAELVLKAKTVATDAQITFDPSTSVAVLGLDSNAVSSLIPTTIKVVAVVPSVTPTPTSAVRPSPTSTNVKNGLSATYYDNINFTGFQVSRVDPQIQFNWGSGIPSAGIQADTFSVVWTGFVVPSSSEEYTFYTRTDDGVRLWVNNVKLVDDWRNHSATERRGKIKLEQGKRYPIRMEYYERYGSALAQLRWSSLSTPKQFIPQTQLFTE